MSISFAAPTVAVEDEDTALDHAYAMGWTDGLPIVPPTPERVEIFLEAAALAPGEVVGEVPTRDVVVTAESAAINAVMAGCAPEHFPVAVAAMRAHFRTEGNSHSTTATLAGVPQVIVVNGPVRDSVGVASGQACFGPGFRANATIGRALRLVIRNVCGSVPGGLDRATFSTPMRYSFCFGENEEASDWTPLHVQRGHQRDESVATVFSLFNLQRATSYSVDPDAIIGVLATEARYVGVDPDEFLGDGRSLLIVMGPEQQRRFVDAGWTKERVQEQLHSRLVAPTTGPHDKRCDLVSPANIPIVAAGGPGMAESWIFQPHLSNPVSEVIA